MAILVQVSNERILYCNKDCAHKINDCITTPFWDHIALFLSRGLIYVDMWLLFNCQV